MTSEYRNIYPQHKYKSCFQKSKELTSLNTCAKYIQTDCIAARYHTYHLSRNLAPIILFKALDHVHDLSSKHRFQYITRSIEA